jgi:hypothetical protein
MSSKHSQTHGQYNGLKLFLIFAFFNGHHIQATPYRFGGAPNRGYVDAFMSQQMCPKIIYSPNLQITAEVKMEPFVVNQIKTPKILFGEMGTEFSCHRIAECDITSSPPDVSSIKVCPPHHCCISYGSEQKARRQDFIVF